MAHYLLDANILIHAQTSGVDVLRAVVEACRRVGASLAGAVHSELTGEPRIPSGPGPTVRQREMRQTLDSRLTVSPVGMTGPSAVIYQHLRQGRSTPADAGECESIALAAVDSETSFVTEDRGEAWLGVVELRGRVRSLAAFLEILVKDGDLDSMVAERVLANQQVRRPHWWPASEPE